MYLIYCILVTKSAYSNQHSSNALQLSQAIIDCGHKIDTIFFYQDGVYNANSCASPSKDEKNLVLLWSKFADNYNIKLSICMSSAQSRGIIFKKNNKFLYSNLQKKFKIDSLSSLAYAIMNSDRFIQF